MPRPALVFGIESLHSVKKKREEAPVNVIPVNLVTFRGEAEYQRYLGQLRGMTPPSVERLAHIKRNEKNEGLKHIALAVFYGLRDGKINELNTEIRRLIKERNRSRQNNAPLFEQASEHLSDLRRAIETVLLENGYDKSGHKLDKQG